MFRKIDIANGGSSEALIALRGAIDIAARYGAELHMISIERIPYVLMTIAEVDDLKAEARHKFVSLLERSRQLAAFKGVAVEGHLVQGEPISAIVEFLRAHRFDLLVIGVKTRPALYNWFAGSTIDRLVDRAPCPVLVIK